MVIEREFAQGCRIIALPRLPEFGQNSINSTPNLRLRVPSADRGSVSGECRSGDKCYDNR